MQTSKLITKNIERIFKFFAKLASFVASCYYILDSFASPYITYVKTSGNLGEWELILFLFGLCIYTCALIVFFPYYQIFLSKKENEE
jgi:hypothetical protein